MPPKRKPRLLWWSHRHGPERWEQAPRGGGLRVAGAPPAQQPTGPTGLSCRSRQNLPPVSRAPHAGRNAPGVFTTAGIPKAGKTGGRRPQS